MDRYRPLTEAKYGGFGNATLCEDTHLNRKVIVKKINDLSELDRLLNEIEALQKVKSKHVVQIYDVISLEDGSFALVEEFLPGEDLTTFKLDDENINELIKILYQLSSGLADIHDCSIVHRDFKPDNVKFDGEGILKIFDFGLSKHRRLPDSTSGIIGTYGYMAPELFQSPPIIDKPVDCYAFGCICFFLITGKPPKCARKSPIPRPQHVSESIARYIDIEENISDLINSCLKIDPEQRTTMHSMKNILKSKILFGKHKATIILDSKKYLLNKVGDGVKIARSVKIAHRNIDSITIGYDGYKFSIQEVSGNVYINNSEISKDHVLEGSSVITLGHPNAGASRRFATFDISHPEVIL